MFIVRFAVFITRGRFVKASSLIGLGCVLKNSYACSLSAIANAISLINHFGFALEVPQTRLNGMQTV